MEILRCSSHNLSRFDLKKISGYSMSSVLELTKEMIKEGLIYEEECEEARVGRKPAWLKINPLGGFYVGLEFNAQYMNCVAMDLVGNVLSKNTRKTLEKGTAYQVKAEDILAQIQEMLKEALAELPDQEKVIGIGLGAPGYVDRKAGISHSYSRIPAWKNIHLRDIIENAFGIPCYIQNNVSVMTLAYKWLYYNGNSSDFIFISIRTGIRMVTISNNRLVSGKDGFAGELGHIKVNEGGRICTCGRYGCLNSEVSDPAIVSKIQEGFGVGRFQRILELANGEEEQVSIAHYVQAVREGDGDAVQLMRLTARILGRALALVVNILAPGEVVLSGEQFGIGEEFLREIRMTLKEEVIVQNYKNLRIKKSDFGKEIGAIGAASMVMEEYFSYQDMEV